MKKTQLVSISVTNKFGEGKTFNNIPVEFLTRDYKTTLIRLYNINVLDYIETFEKHNGMTVAIENGGGNIPKTVKFDSKNNGTIFYGDLKLNIKLRDAIIDNRRLNLTNKEFVLLKLLMENMNSAVTKETIFNIVWDTDNVQDGKKTLDTHIKTLRKKLGVYRYNVVTVYNHGYAFTEYPTKDRENI